MAHLVLKGDLRRYLRTNILQHAHNGYAPNPSGQALMTVNWSRSITQQQECLAYCRYVHKGPEASGKLQQITDSEGSAVEISTSKGF